MHNDLKDRAKKLKEELANNYSTKITHTQALNIVAKVENYDSFADYNNKNDVLKKLEDNHRESTKEANDRLHKLFIELKVAQDANMESFNNYYEYEESFLFYLNKLLEDYFVLDNIKLMAKNSETNMFGLPDTIPPYIKILETSLFYYNRDNFITSITAINKKHSLLKDIKIVKLRKNSFHFKKVEEVLNEILEYYSIYKLDPNMYAPIYNFLNGNKDYHILREDKESINLFGRDIIVGNSDTYINLKTKKSAKAFHSFLGISFQEIINNIQLAKNEDYNEAYVFNEKVYYFDGRLFSSLFETVLFTTHLFDIELFNDDSHENYTIKDVYAKRTNETLENYFFKLFLQSSEFDEFEVFSRLAKRHLKLNLNDGDFDDIEELKKTFGELIKVLPEFELLKFLNDFSSYIHIIKEEKLYELLNTAGISYNSRIYKEISDYIYEFYDAYSEDGELSEEFEKKDLIIATAIQIATKDIFTSITNKEFGTLNYGYLFYLKATQKRTKATVEVGPKRKNKSKKNDEV